MIRYHPDDALLLAHVAGNLPAGAALVVESHLEMCAHCCTRLHDLQAVGGVLLEELAPEPLRPDALTLAMAAIDAHPAFSAAPRRAALAELRRPDLPAGAAWPRSLQGCGISPWRWLGPGMRWSRVTVPHDSAANVFLLRIGAGKMLPSHTHSELELTQVLFGEFHDGRAHFGPGDFDGADGGVHHQPVVGARGECICLASVQGRVLFDGFLARTMGALVGM